MAQDDVGGRLIEVLTQLDELSGTLTVDEAISELDEATLQVFWRDWPNINAWAATIWGRLNEDLARPARPPDSAIDEVAGGGWVPGRYPVAHTLSNCHRHAPLLSTTYALS